MTTNDIEKLLTVQKHDCRIRDTEKELRDIPARKKLEQDRLDTHKNEIAAAEEDIKAKQAAMKEQELEVDARRVTINKLRQQQLEIKTNREFKAIESEISGFEKEISKLEDRELVLMEDLDAVVNNHDTMGEALNEEETAVGKDLLVWDERAVELNKDLVVERALREEAVQGINAEWLAQYERLFSRKGKAFVMLDDGVCGGCHMQLPPYVVHETKKRQSMVACSYCGCFLY